MNRYSIGSHESKPMPNELKPEQSNQLARSKRFTITVISAREPARAISRARVIAATVDGQLE